MPEEMSAMAQHPPFTDCHPADILPQDSMQVYWSTGRLLYAKSVIYSNACLF